MIWVLALIAFGFSRLFNLRLIPIFADEAIYLKWAQLTSVNIRNLFLPLSDGKTPLFMWLLAPLLKLNADPLLVGRLVSVIAGLATVVGIYFLSRKLFTEKMAKVATALAIIQPFLLFYDRLSLVDSLLTALIVWSAYLAIKFLNKPRLSSALSLSLVWAAALLTKPSAGMYLVLTAGLLLVRPKKKWLPTFKKAWVWTIVAGGLAITIYSLQRLSGAYHMIARRTADYLQPPRFSVDTVQIFLGWINSYFGAVALVVLALSLGIAIYRRERKLIWLGAMFIVPFLVQVVIGKIVYPRYFLPLAPFMVISLAWGLIQFKRWFLPVTLLLVLPWLKLDYQLLTRPEVAELPQAEKTQYFYEWSAGYGLKEIGQFLNQLPEEERVLVATEGSFGTLPDGLQIYFAASKQIKVVGVGFPKTTIDPGMEAALAEGKTVFIVANQHRYNWSQINRLHLIAEYPRIGGEKLMFYQVLPENEVN